MARQEQNKGARSKKMGPNRRQRMHVQNEPQHTFMCVYQTRSRQAYRSLLRDSSQRLQKSQAFGKNTCPVAETLNKSRTSKSRCMQKTLDGRQSWRRRPENERLPQTIMWHRRKITAATRQAAAASTRCQKPSGTSF